MVRKYKFVLRSIVIIVFLSIIKFSVWVDSQITYYPLSVAHSMIFRVTRLNWQYGFFTSKSNNYQFIKSDITLVDPEDAGRDITIAKNSGIDRLVLPINAVRINTSIQQMIRDSLYLETGSRSIAIYLFRKYPSFRNMDFSIQTHNQKIKVANNRFVISNTIDTLFNRRIGY